MSTEPVSRRGLLKKAAVTGLLATAPASAQTPDSTPAPPKPDAITLEDAATLDRLAGRAYPEAERKKMLKGLGENRDAFKLLRAEKGLTERTEIALSFDPLPPGTPAPRLKKELRPSRVKTPAYDGKPESLAFASVTELGQLLRERKITSVALTRMYLDRLKTYGPRLHCVITLLEESALRQAERADKELAGGRVRGPLHGIPYGAKDLFAVKGVPTTWGAAPYRNQVFDYDATVIRRLDEAGAVLLAKLSMGELAMGDVWFGGLTRNPWNPKQGSSGSSAGSGAAVAAGLVAFALGTETSGSIVSPSVRCGVTGLRPTYGRVPRTGAMALCWSLDRVGPMGRAVEDCALVLSVIHGPDGEDATVPAIPFGWNAGARLDKLRVGVDTAAFKALEKNAKRKPIYDAALESLKKAGVKTVPLDLPSREATFDALASLLIGVEAGAAFADLTLSGRVAELAQQGQDSWPTTFRVASAVPATDYVHALRVRAALQREMAQAMQGVDCFVTVPFGNMAGFHGANLCGYPTLVTRCGQLDGQPVSLEFTGNLYREDAAVRVALAFERATEWHKQWPDVEKLPVEPPKPGRQT